MEEGPRCTFSACGDLDAFPDISGFLNHAARVHEYDLKIKLENVSKRRRSAPASMPVDSVLRIDPRLLAASEGGM